MRTNYILIDFENVQPGLLATGGAAPLKVMIFVGEGQTKIPFDLAASIQSLGENAEYIKITGNGSNALDFHIAYYIGKLAESDPKSFFHIVTKDKGFDPLIKHLRKNKILAQRVASLAEIPVLNSLFNTNMEQRIEAVVESLRGRGSSKPRRVKTLENTLRAFFADNLKENEITAIINRLVKLNYVKINEQVVSYAIPSK